MPVGLSDQLPTLHPIAGVSLASGSIKIKKNGKPDLVLIELAEGTRTAAVFTQNRFCAAPVTLAKAHLEATSPRLLMINSGNANAGTGEAGMAAAVKTCDAAAKLLGCEAKHVLPFSTGVIGEVLPAEKFETGMADVYAQLSPLSWEAAARGIMTTDIVPKALSKVIEIDGHSVTITGIAKGSGMIHPNMATMLGFIATDAALSQALLQQCITDAANQSFNRVTVDGDTSTNDACTLSATGQSTLPEITDVNSKAYAQFSQAVNEITQFLAHAIVRDGEGATKFITVQVEGGKTQKEALDVAFTVAHSPLVKTAFFASDPNWGRILAAAGRAGIEDLDVTQVQVFLGDVCIVRNGGRAADYTEEQGQRVMKAAEITIRILLNRGTQTETVWTCDFSYDYVKINAEYRS